MDIRERKTEDDAAIAAVLRDAFGGEVEVRLVDQLRADGDMACEFVAERDGAIAGHIAFSRLDVRRGDAQLSAVALAPLAVASGMQRGGIGSALTRAGLRACRARGVALAVVLGHADYYPRFGFSAQTARLLDAPYAGEGFQAVELSPGVLRAARWHVTYPTAFARME